MSEYQELLKNKDFVKFWIGGTVSKLGDQLNVVAISWLILEATGSASFIGIALSAFAVPMIVTSFFMGILLDRFSRKYLLILDNIARGILYSSITIIYWLELFSLPALMIIMFMAGILSTISRVGSATVIPNLVPDEQLEKANGLSQITWQLAYLSGPALGGVLTSIIGPSYTLIVDSLTFWIFSGLMLTIPAYKYYEKDNQQEDEHKSSDWFQEGFRFLIKRKDLLIITIATTMFYFTYAPMEPALPLFTQVELNQGASIYGVIKSVMSVGMIVGTLIWGYFKIKANPLFTVSVIILLWGITNMAFAYSNTIFLAFITIFFAGFVFGPYNLVVTTYKQRTIEDRKHGRVFGVMNSVSAAGLPLGQVAGGFLVDATTAQFTLFAAGLLSVLVAILVVFSINAFHIKPMTTDKKTL
ncbi:MFS transporter [Pontibacillus marinus]|uniref:Major facilitator superfamily (MFS) profile domain-containing protein n=1 Tax=Pontibacillus marinus BH030004 = DSM 16465 TaxID=1385511 RepID=A0A0A5G6H3_9BACI|nr:MFS transporter [Pontibacillus marinus]KGX88726.1 hypothetical protein N783_07350 [Pontibacillus marinus BH030004 = DSM 16465]